MRARVGVMRTLIAAALTSVICATHSMAAAAKSGVLNEERIEDKI
jgi:hypothetical protein